MQDEVIETPESTPEEGTTQESTKGTTARLFGDLMGGEDTSTEATPEPVKAEEKTEDKPEKKRDEKGRFTSEAKTDEKADTSEYLSIEDFGDRKVKVKVNGVEKEISFKDVIRGYQTDQAFTQKGQKVAEEYNRLKTLKPENIQVQATSSQEVTKGTDDEFYREYIAPHIEPYKKKIDALENTLGGFQGVIAPLAYENNLKAVDRTLKAEGYDDFLQYKSKIEDFILNLPVEEQVLRDTPQDYISIYKDLKIQDLRKEMTGKKEEKKNPDARPAPKLVNIEGGANTPSGVDDSDSTIIAAKKKA